MAGPVELAVRPSVAAGDRLPTPTGRGTFVVEWFSSDGLVMLLGPKRAWTPLPWECFEGLPDFLRGSGWVLVGSLYDVDGRPDTLDGYLKQFLRRATAGYVALVLERAGVVELDRSRPARVRLSAHA